MWFEHTNRPRFESYSSTHWPGYFISLVSLWEVNYAYVYIDLWASLMSQMVKNLQAMQENKFQALGWEDPLEKGMSTHSSILAQRIAWTEEPGRLQSMELQRV